MAAIGRFRVLAIGLILLRGVAAEAAPDPLRIAVVGPMSGEHGAYGQQTQLGVGAAVRDLNAADTLGRPVRVEVLDDACDPELAVAIAQKLVAERPDLVIGHDCSAASLAAEPIYAAAGIVQITPTATSPLLTERGIGTIFRMIGRDDRQAAQAAELIAKRWPQGRIAVLDDGATFGKGLADATVLALHADGVNPALRADYRSGEGDFRPLAQRLAAAKIDVVFIGGYEIDVALLTQQLRRSGLATQVIGGDALSSSDFWKVAGASGEGTLFTFPPDARANPAAAEVVAHLRAGGFEPEGHTLLAYAAVQVWAQAVGEAGAAGAAAIAATLHSRTLNSVIGRVRFDAKGDIHGEGQDFVWYVWHDGKPVPVRP